MSFDSLSCTSTQGAELFPPPLRPASIPLWTPDPRASFGAWSPASRGSWDRPFVSNPQLPWTPSFLSRSCGAFQERAPCTPSVSGSPSPFPLSLSPASTPSGPGGWRGTPSSTGGVLEEKSRGICCLFRLSLSLSRLPLLLRLFPGGGCWGRVSSGRGLGVSGSVGEGVGERFSSILSSLPTRSLPLPSPSPSPGVLGPWWAVPEGGSGVVCVSPRWSSLPPASPPVGVCVGDLEEKQERENREERSLFDSSICVEGAVGDLSSSNLSPLPLSSPVLLPPISLPLLPIASWWSGAISRGASASCSLILPPLFPPSLSIDSSEGSGTIL